MLVSGREVAAGLGTVGVPRSQARRLLAAGALGGRLRTPGADLWDELATLDLMSRPLLTPDAVRDRCPDGLFVSRRALDLTVPRHDQLATIDGGWGFSRWTAVLLQSRLARTGSFPLVATVAGFVLLGADIVGLGRREGAWTLRLAEPGAWFEGVRHTRLPGLRGGRDWAIHGWHGNDHTALPSVRATRRSQADG